MSDIEVTIANGIVKVLLNRPASRNAVTLAMWQEMVRLFAHLGADRSVRGIVLAGAGGNFSVGADVSEFAAVRGTVEAATAYEIAVDAAADAIAAVPQPVIAALEGYCLGGGCHLALAADFRFAAPTAAVGIPSAKLSIVYGVRSTQRLLALVGLAAAKRLLYGAERIDGSAALQMGLVERIAENPRVAAEAYARELSQLAPLSTGGAKAILTGLSMGPGALDPGVAQSLIDKAAGSHDYEEGRRAFAEKRAPQFIGE
jgi:enoyl-CoA hydratase/carnithine racemase